MKNMKIIMGIKGKKREEKIITGFYNSKVKQIYVCRECYDKKCFIYKNTTTYRKNPKIMLFAHKEFFSSQQTDYSFI